MFGVVNLRYMWGIICNFIYQENINSIISKSVLLGYNLILTGCYTAPLLLLPCVLTVREGKHT